MAAGSKRSLRKLEKLKKRSQQTVDRRKAKKTDHDRVLIVCEGEKTEPNYLEELIDYLQLSSADIVVDGRSDSSPDKIFKYAKEKRQEEIQRGDVYNRIYCVFDKDEHSTFEETKQKILRYRPNNLFIPCISISCFEYWILLHYEYSTRPYHRKGDKSPCHCVIDDLKKYIPDYEKNRRGIFQEIEPKTKFAIANSKRIQTQNAETGTDNPSTQMHELVEYLYDLNRQKQARHAG